MHEINLKFFKIFGSRQVAHVYIYGKVNNREVTYIYRVIYMTPRAFSFIYNTHIYMIRSNGSNHNHKWKQEHWQQSDIYIHIYIGLRDMGKRDKIVNMEGN